MARRSGQIPNYYETGPTQGPTKSFRRRLAIALADRAGLHRAPLARLPSQPASPIGNIVFFALRELHGRTEDKCLGLMTPRALQSLAKHLDRWLNLVIGPAIRVIEKGRIVGPPTDSQPVRPSNREVPLVEATGFLMLFPSLAETLTLLVWDWIEAQRELLIRLKKDEKLLSDLVGSRAGLGQLTDVRVGLSDPHDGGRTVTVLRFANGKHLVYKPRPCSGELLWQQLLTVFNEEGFESKFWIPQICSRSNYHWMEFIVGHSCPNEAAVERFYRRWGAQAAVATLFRFADLHCENWAAVGEHPVLLDAEVFGWTTDGAIGAKVLASELEPVLASGLVPFAPATGLPYYGMAPLDIPSRFGRIPGAWPIFAGKAQAPMYYSREIIAGFAAAMDLLAKNKRAFRRVQELFQNAQGSSPRVLFRSTMAYQQMLRASLEAHEIFLNPTRLSNLRAKCLTSAASPEIAEAEALALLRCSLPRFVAKPQRWTRDQRQLAGLNQRKLLLVSLRRNLLAAKKHGLRLVAARR